MAVDTQQMIQERLYGKKLAPWTGQPTRTRPTTGGQGTVRGGGLKLPPKAARIAEQANMRAMGMGSPSQVIAANQLPGLAPSAPVSRMAYAPRTVGPVAMNGPAISNAPGATLPPAMAQGQAPGAVGGMAGRMTGLPMGAAAGSVDDLYAAGNAASNASILSRGGGSLSARMAAGVVTPGATGLAKYAAPQFLNKAGTGLAMRSVGAKAIPYVGTGLLASSIIDQAVPGSNSAGEQALQGAAMGAGTGALVGSIFPVVGTGVGALVGGGLGALTGWLTSGDDDKDAPTKTPSEALFAGLDSAASNGLLTPEQNVQYRALYKTLVEMGGGETVDGVRENAAAQIQQMASQDIMMAMDPSTQQATTPEEMMAMQAYAAKTLKPYMDNIAVNNATRNSTLQSMVGQLPEEYRGPLQASILNESLAGSTLLNAYGAQAAMAPFNMGMEAYMSQNQSIANQLSQQAIQMQLNPPTDQAASGDLSSLLAQQQPAA